MKFGTNMLACAALSVTLSACGAETATTARPKGATYIPPNQVKMIGGGAAPTIYDGQGVANAGIVGSDARGLVQMFGTAAQDVREGNARKLQFSNQYCVLDAYLYPAAKGNVPLVTFIATRTPDGRDAERNSCIATLKRR